jgi:phosphoenolpyruvate carboxykinase (ATP)
MSQQITHHQLSAQALHKLAIDRNEVSQTTGGVIVANTGNRTGRSAQDRYIVEDQETLNSVAWGKGLNQPYPKASYAELFATIKTHIEDQDVCFTGDYHVGMHPNHYAPVTLKTTHAWHQLFAQHMFITPPTFNPKKNAAWTIWHAPTLTLDAKKHKCRSTAIVLLNFTERTILIAGTAYAGEIKKAMFSVQNYLLPMHDILPMHCAATQNAAGKVSVFFGLSGTGKTTLSSAPDCSLIGDDEHGWSSHNVFNLEGGCYAKTFGLDPTEQPDIFNAIKGTAVCENIVLNEQGQPDYHDATYTKNGRVAYPRTHITHSLPTNAGPSPSSVLFLSCDLFGVLPPISLLSTEQAVFYFLNGYTAKVGSTEMGSSQEVAPTFSHCFGAPFFPRHVAEYANLLRKRLEETQAKVYLVNTGWTGGQYGQGGHRFSIPKTRTVVSAIMNDQINWQDTETISILNLTIPKSIPNLDAIALDPRTSWQNKQAYYETANHLATLFQKNFNKYRDQVSKQVIESGPMPVETTTAS